MTFEASDTVARLATEIDPIKWEKARLTFWRLYWGTLAIVEDGGRGCDGSPRYASA
jgi:hypothetical protein